MTDELASQRFEVTFVGRPPIRQVARASGVTEVEVDGSLLRCLVTGSVQAFLEALHGYEVIGLTSAPAVSKADGPGQLTPEEELGGERGGG